MISQAWFGASWKMAAFVCYAGLNVIAKCLEQGSITRTALPASEIVFFQDLFALCCLLPWIVKTKAYRAFLTHTKLNLARALFSALGIICWYSTLNYLPLGDAVALSIIGPIIGVGIAKIVLKEKMGKMKLFLITVSFLLACGLGHISQVFESHAYNTYGLMLLMVSCVMFAAAKVTTRRLALDGASPWQLTATLFLIIVPISLVPAMYSWVTPTLAHAPWLIMAGIVTCVAIYCVSCALAYAEVSFLAPFDITQFVLNGAIGYFAFMELPSPWVFWMVFIVMALTIAFRYRALAR